ncbi:MAG: hypothetical protein GY830_09820 [Bacteroidetes bacterium]|nr:hypothetical protein [Bacteroidota bacterium]
MSNKYTFFFTVFKIGKFDLYFIYYLRLFLIPLFIGSCQYHQKNNMRSLSLLYNEDEKNQTTDNKTKGQILFEKDYLSDEDIYFIQNDIKDVLNKYPNNFYIKNSIQKWYLKHPKIITSSMYLGEEFNICPLYETICYEKYEYEKLIYLRPLIKEKCKCDQIPFLIKFLKEKVFIKQIMPNNCWQGISISSNDRNTYLDSIIILINNTEEISKIDRKEIYDIIEEHDNFTLCRWEDCKKNHKERKRLDKITKKLGIVNFV